MAIRKIAQMGEPVLRRRADTVTPELLESQRVKSLIADMIETMHDADGAGIAAPQVYESLRICVIEVNANRRYPDFPGIPQIVLVNPVVESLVGAPPALRDEDSISLYEGCLSVNGVRGRVRRPRKVRVRALDATGAPLDLVWEGVSAAIVQHETDHLDGVLFVDRADTRSLTFLREFDRFVPATERTVDGARPNG